MPKIHKLPPHIAGIIAAGEVVERPSSVIKELTENSFDAGADTITVEVTLGGMTFMRVTDNGCGIAPEDAKTAFLRHATSKLHSAEGLEAIGTLGFRGEALAAIAAVSRIELMTREHGANEGVSLTIEAGEVVESHSVGCPEGTTIVIRDLFFNTPARLKFTKSDRAEGAAISNTVLHAALSHPGVSVRFIKDGKLEFHTPGDSRVDSCVRTLFGPEFAAGLLQVDSSDEYGNAVRGFISSPNADRGNRSNQHFFVNGRYVKSKTLQTAVERAYANLLSSNRYPSCVLYLTIGLGNVDVNVHPAKTEVKFFSDKQIFDCVHYAVRGALEHPLPIGAEPVRTFKTVERFSEKTATVPASPRKAATQTSAAPVGNGGADAPLRKPDNFVGEQLQLDEPPAPHVFVSKVPMDRERGVHSDVRDETVTTYHTKFTPMAESSVTEPAVTDSAADDTPPLRKPFRLIGEALGTYAIVEYGDSVVLVDKHAAHERIHFNALKSGDYQPMSQSLITPILCRHGHEDAVLLFENADVLERLGFSVESLGADTVAVRRIPADIDVEETESALSEICTDLRRRGTAEPAWLDNILRTVACKAAIKAGKSTDKRELEVLVNRVLSGEITHCPHGRPVSFEMTKAALDRSFKRI